MGAFDKIRSGISGLDKALDSIRLGDNVVWQISDLEEFRTFAEPFARQAVADGRNVIYIRFAQHAPVLRDLSGIQVCRFNPDEGFEPFTVAIHEEITRQGRDAFYVFDCLSELQSVWYTDLMMGNFFRVTCPYLFELDTVAYFPLMRGRHSFDAVARIRDTTQLLLNIYSDEKHLYLHPMKVWNRYSEKMFLPHRMGKETQEFSVISDGVEMSRFYQIQQRFAQTGQDQNFDSHDRFFSRAKMQFSQGIFPKETQEQIIRSTMTKDSRLKALVEDYFRPEDYFSLRERMIGSGAVGGKACGMLLARKIAETEIPEYAEHDEPHDSFSSVRMCSTPILCPTAHGSCASASDLLRGILMLRENCRNACSMVCSRQKSGNGLWMCWSILVRTHLLFALPASWRMALEMPLPESTILFSA